MPVVGHSYARGCRCDECRERHNAQCRASTLRYITRIRNSGIVPDEMHGTVTGYKTHRCRCDRCREAYRTHCRNLRAAGPTAGTKHGLTGYTMNGCKCRKCKAAASAYSRSRRQASA